TDRPAARRRRRTGHGTADDVHGVAAPLHPPLHRRGVPSPAQRVADHRQSPLRPPQAPTAHPRRPRRPHRLGPDLRGPLRRDQPRTGRATTPTADTLTAAPVGRPPAQARRAPRPGVLFLLFGGSAALRWARRAAAPSSRSETHRTTTDTTSLFLREGILRHGRHADAKTAPGLRTRA